MPAEFRGVKSGEGDDAPDGGSARPADSARQGGSARMGDSAQHGSLTRPYSQPQLSFPQENKQNCFIKNVLKMSVGWSWF